MKKYTKVIIDKLAKEIMELLEKDGCDIDTCVYWNNKRASMKYRWKDYDYVREGWVIEENVCPLEYLEYASEQHVISLTFEGNLYYKYNDGDYEYPAMDALLEKYGLYSEMGNAWNWTACPIHDIEEYEYTDYRDKRKPEPKLIFMHTTDIPVELMEIRNWWYKKSSEYGDIGCCVIGAGFEFEYKGEHYKMSSASPYQGNCSWESSIDDVRFMLYLIGCTEVYYNYGMMD